MKPGDVALGDTVTWLDVDTGGWLSGTVVTIHECWVMVATDRGGGMVGYNRVDYQKIRYTKKAQP